MDTALLWVGIILSGLAVVLLALVLYRSLKSKGPADSGTAERALGKIEGDLGHLKDDLSASINSSVQKEVNGLLQAQLGQNEAAGKRLNEFQGSISQNIENRFNSVNDTIEKRLNEIQGKVDERLRNGFVDTGNSLGKVNEALGRITEAQKNLDGLNSQVSNLNSILKNSQQRGRFGEISLAGILNQVFGNTHGIYELQYEMKNADGSTVRPDAIVRMPSPVNILCIDSKFSFAAYQALFANGANGTDEQLKKSMAAALKSQIDKIAKDYIVHGQTAEYAIMYLPADGIYAYIQSDEYLYGSVIEHAKNRNVVITSPATLQPILANLNILNRNVETRKNIDVILKQLGIFQKEAKDFAERWEKFAGSMDTMNKRKDEFSTVVNKLSNKAEFLLNYVPKDELTGQGGAAGSGREDA